MVVGLAESNSRNRRRLQRSYTMGKTGFHDARGISSIPWESLVPTEKTMESIIPLKRLNSTIPEWPKITLELSRIFFASQDTEVGTWKRRDVLHETSRWLVGARYSLTPSVRPKFTLDSNMQTKDQRDQRRLLGPAGTTAAIPSLSIIAQFSRFSRLYCATRLLRQFYARAPSFYCYAIKRASREPRPTRYVV